MVVKCGRARRSTRAGSVRKSVVRSDFRWILVAVLFEVIFDLRKGLFYLLVILLDSIAITPVSVASYRR